MNWRTYRIVWVIAFFALSTYALATDHYVDPNTGNDSNPGTEAAPWATVDFAVGTTKVKSGDRILFAAGTQNSVVDGNAGAWACATATLMPWSPGTEITVAYINLNSPGWKLEGLNVQSGSQDRGIQLGASADWTVLSGIDVGQMDRYALIIGADSDFNTFYYSTFRGDHARGPTSASYGAALQAASADYLDFYHCDFARGTNTNTYLVANTGSYTLYEDCTFSAFTNPGNIVAALRLVSNATVRRCVLDGATNFGITIASGSTNVLLENGVVMNCHGNHGIGVDPGGWSDFTVRNYEIINCAVGVQQAGSILDDVAIIDTGFINDTSAAWMTNSRTRAYNCSVWNIHTTNPWWTAITGGIVVDDPLICAGSSTRAANNSRWWVEWTDYGGADSYIGAYSSPACWTPTPTPKAEIPPPTPRFPSPTPKPSPTARVITPTPTAAIPSPTSAFTPSPSPTPTSAATPSPVPSASPVPTITPWDFRFRDKSTGGAFAWLHDAEGSSWPVGAMNADGVTWSYVNNRPEAYYWWIGQFTSAGGDVHWTEWYYRGASRDGHDFEYPTPSPTAATPTPSPTPTKTPTPSPTATPSPEPTATPSPSPSPTPTATPTPSPSPSPTATPSPTPTATPSPSPTATPSPSPRPIGYGRYW